MNILDELLLHNWVLKGTLRILDNAYAALPPPEL
jgi:hypothetical protein